MPIIYRKAWSSIVTVCEGEARGMANAAAFHESWDRLDYARYIK